VLEDTRLQVRLTVEDCDVAVRLRDRGVLRLELSDGRQASSELEVQPDGFEEFLARVRRLTPPDLVQSRWPGRGPCSRRPCF